jgi:hypothetical protein
MYNPYGEVHITNESDSNCETNSVQRFVLALFKLYVRITLMDCSFASDYSLERHEVIINVSEVPIASNFT